MSHSSNLQPFSYSHDEQRSLLAHFIAYRLRLDDLGRLMDIRNILLSNVPLPAPTWSDDPTWSNAASVVSNVIDGYMVSLFDSTSDSVDCRVLLPRLYLEQAGAIRSFFQRHEAVIQSYKRFRNKAVAHMDRRLDRLIQAHAHGHGAFTEHNDFVIGLIKLTHELQEQEQAMVSRFTIDMKAYVTEIALRTGVMPKRLHQLLLQFGLGGNWG